MKNTSVNRLRLLPLFATLAGLAGAGLAVADDTYDPQTGLLTIPSLIIGSADYQNVVVKVGSILAGPTGTSPTQVGDFYDTTNNELFIAAVDVGTNTYYNPIITVGSLVSIGTVSGADTYGGGALFLPSVQVLGGPLYQSVDVSVAPGQIQQVAGGMPVVAQNTYDPATDLLTIPVAVYNGKYYTNVTATVTLADVRQVLGGRQGADSVTYAFTGNADGSNPAAALIQGPDGTFYGTTSGGGGSGYGTVFSLSPAGVITVLYSFTGTDGGVPFAPLVLDSHGNLFGTTTTGGQYGEGTVFEIPAGGQLTTLWSFTGGGGVSGSADGANPNGLVLGQDGNLYGTTTNGGSGTCTPNGCGVVFEVTLPAGVETPIYSFAGGTTDGANPYAGLLQASNGLLYGTTLLGGTNNNGVIFSITTAGSEALAWSFGAAVDGAFPEAGLIQASDGTLYGTTYGGGTNGVGTVFSYSPTSQQERALYSFAGAGGIPGSPDGAYPFGGVIQGTDGALYGAAYYGGAYNEGSVFRLTTAGVETTLYSFNGDDALANSADGAYPNAVIQGSDGNLYGTAYYGGASGYGAVFKLAP